MSKKPYDILFKISGQICCDDDGNDKNRTVDINSQHLKKLTGQFNSIEELKSYKLNHEDIMIIAVCWYELIDGGHFGIDPLSALEHLYKPKSRQIKKLDKIITLLKKSVFYTSEKEIYIKKHSRKKPLISYKPATLLKSDIEFHNSFMDIIMGNKENISLFNERPYKDNKEFLDDWFSYVDRLHEFNFHSIDERSKYKKLNKHEASEYLDVLDWKNRINKRSIKTTKVFPLIDLKNEYSLDENEITILIYLIKEEIANRNCDTDELVQLISSDVHDLYLNREYVSENSKLAKKGLIELSEGVLFLSKSSDIRVAPDIVRRIIMRTPTSDDEKLAQTLKNNDIFTLVEPSQNFDDLILPEEMKKTIKFSLNQYSSNVDNILKNWGLFGQGLKFNNNINLKTEPGMLMLFYGAPGTGKTFAAGAIAQALDKKLLISDISRIQSKWVGDSEKNVRRLFSTFERIIQRVDNPPVLLLNEADQFLMKRIDQTNNSVDKMLNSMQNLFLEAFENLRGILIATTNLRSNLDDAFSRRFHLKLEFPLPDVKERKKLWQLHLLKSIPGVAEINISTLSVKFPLSGGQIKIIVKNACVEAASRRGVFQKLMLKDIVKYCEIETSTCFDQRKIVGFQ